MKNKKVERKKNIKIQSTCTSNRSIRFIAFSTECRILHSTVRNNENCITGCVSTITSCLMKSEYSNEIEMFTTKFTRKQ